MTEELLHDLAGLVGDDLPKPPMPSTNGAGPTMWAESNVFTGDRGMTWTPRNAAENLLASGLRVATGGGELYIHREGRYVRGDAVLRELLARQLGEHWRPGRAADVVAYLSAVAPELWERPPLDRLNVANGILDLGAGELAPHDAAFLSPVQIPVAFDPEATCPAIDTFMGEVFPEDSRALGYEWPGLLLVPDTGMQRTLLLLGIGENAKSVFLGLTTELVGAENVSTRTLQDLAENRFAAADLYGKLANISADIPGTALRQSGLFKRLSGEDRITAERKYSAAFQFQPFVRLLFSGQEVPPSADASHAYRRRWQVLRFVHTFTGKPCPACGASHKRNPRLLEKLTTPDELSGFLNRAVAAYLDLRERGSFTETASTAAGAAELDDAIDDTHAFIEECCVQTDGARVDRAALYRAYRTWCEANGHRPIRDRRFYDRIRACGFEEHPYAGRPSFHSLGLASEVRR